MEPRYTSSKSREIRLPTSLIQERFCQKGECITSNHAIGEKTNKCIMETSMNSILAFLLTTKATVIKQTWLHKEALLKTK